MTRLRSYLGILVFVLACALDLAGCVATSPARYPVLGASANRGDTLYAVNVATGKWQLCYLDSAWRVRFIGEPRGRRLDARGVR